MTPQPDPHDDHSAPLPRVTILLATYNGARHLQEQLDSYVRQTCIHWDLWVSDDGSDDATLPILEAFRSAHGAGRDIRILDGPRTGPAANFMSLLTHPDLPDDTAVALSDQDDVWHPDKLRRALDCLKAHGPVTLYSGQSYHTDDQLQVIGQSRMLSRAPGFRNALTQNVVSGHSIVMDPGALAVVRQAGIPEGIPYHDWWLYQLISGAGGHIEIDAARMIWYRQHGHNAMGAHDGIRASLRRITQIMEQTYGRWIAANTAALERVTPLLTPENQTILTGFRTAPNGIGRMAALRRLGLYRQTRLATIGFYLAAALGRV